MTESGECFNLLNFQSNIHNQYSESSDFIQYCIQYALRSKDFLIIFSCAIYLSDIAVDLIAIYKLSGISNGKYEDQYKILLLKSIILYRLGDVDNAILALRRSYRLKNRISDDPFYNCSAGEKEELYKRKISKFTVSNIEEKVLLPSHWGISSRRKKKKLSLEQLKNLAVEQQKKLEASSESRKIKSQIDDYIGTLRAIFNKVYGDGRASRNEAYRLIISHVDWLIRNGYGTSDTVCIKGDCLIELVGTANTLEIMKIFEVYRKLLTTKVKEEEEEEEARARANAFRRSIIKLHSRIHAGQTVDRLNLLRSAKSCVETWESGCKEFLVEEAKLFCIADIYLEMQNYYMAVEMYLAASKQLNKAKNRYWQFLSFKYSRRLLIIYEKIGMEEMVHAVRKALKENVHSTKKDSEENVEDQSSKRSFYSRIWFEIGREIYYQENEKNKSIPRSQQKIPGKYEQARLALSEAIDDAFEREKAEILVLRGQTLVRCRRFESAKHDFEDALYIDQKFSLSQYTSLRDFRISVEELINIECGKYRDRRMSVGDLVDSVRENYISTVQSLSSPAVENRKYQSRPDKLLDPTVKRKLSELFYIEGSCKLKEFRVSNKRNSFHKTSNLRSRKTLVISHKTLKQAIFLMTNGLNIRQALRNSNVNILTQYYLLEVIAVLAEASYLLNEYEETQMCLKDGSLLLSRLLSFKNDDNERVSSTREANFIKKINLREKFDIIEAYKISFFENEKEAIEQAEMRKNLFLSKLIYMNEKERKPLEDEGVLYEELQYEDLKRVVSSDTIVLYWYVGISEVNTFVLTEEQDYPVNITKSKFDRSRYFDAGKHKRYESYIDCMDDWSLCLKGIQEGVGNRFHKQMGKCMGSFYELLNIDLIIEEIEGEDIKNIVIVPHRDLHRIPLHAFFEGLYNISYLPSLKLGVSLDNKAVYSYSLLNIHPSNNNSHDLLSAYAESTGVGLRCSPVLSDKPSDNRVCWSNADEAKKRVEDNIDYNILHFLGHSVHDFDDPARSSLMLSESQRFTLKEILDDLDLSNYHLVCLSACETGITSPGNIFEEYVGLVSGFLAKGVNYVISSLWKIDDVSSTLLMLEFYRLLITSDNEVGIHPVVALAKAQNWLRNANRSELSRWCSQQAEELTGILENSSYIHKDEITKLQASIEIIKDYSYVFLNLPEPVPFSHFYYWAGFTVTGLPPSPQAVQ